MHKPCFVLMLLNIPVNSYGHVGMVASDFVGLLPDIEMNDTSSPAIRHAQVNFVYLSFSPSFFPDSEALCQVEAVNGV